MVKIPGPELTTAIPNDKDTIFHFDSQIRSRSPLHGAPSLQEYRIASPPSLTYDRAVWFVISRLPNSVNVIGMYQTKPERPPFRIFSPTWLL